jgi:hypothetical protein
MSLFRDLAKKIVAKVDECGDINQPHLLTSYIQQILQDNLIGDNVVVMTKDEYWLIHTTNHCVDCDGEAEFRNKQENLELCGGCIVLRHERGASDE